MEGLAAAGGVFAVVSLAAQVAQGCNYLRGIFDSANSAPREIRFLSTELGIIQGIIEGTPDVNKYHDELDFCHERLSKLHKVVDKYGVLDSVERNKKWGTRLSMALNADKIEKHLNSLREAKGYLERIQNVTAHDLGLVKTREVLESVQQLSTSHSEAARILCRTEGKVDDIGGITRQTQNALHQLADRVVHREALASIRDEKNAQRLIHALESTLREQLADHLQSLSIASSRVSAPTSNGIRTFPDKLALSSGQNIDFSESSTSFGKRKRTHPSPIVHRKNPSFWEPLEADFEDDVEGNEQPHVEKMSKYRSRFGEVRLRTASATYSSLVALKEANGDVASGFHWSQPEHFPVTVTTTEILLLPRNWSKIRLTTIRYQALTYPMLNTRDMPLNGQIHGGSSGLTKPFIAAPITQRQDRLTALKTLEVASTIVKPLTKPSILDVAFETALLAASSKAGNAVVPAVPMETISRQNQQLRKSFNDEINDNLELVHLWLSSGFDADFYSDTISEGTITRKELPRTLFPINCNENQAFHEFRLRYTTQLITEMVNRIVLVGDGSRGLGQINFCGGAGFSG